VAIAAKTAGYFNTPQPEPARKVDIKVLAAARNVFAGDMLDASWVTVRSLRQDELEHYRKYKDDYLPAVQQAASLRVAAKNMPADQPILKEHFKDMAKPEPLTTRLLSNMRAVNVALTKDHSAGGLIQVGEWVDVLFTSQVDSPQGSTVRTACIAPKV